MGNLAHIVEGLNSDKDRQSETDAVRGNLDSMLDGRFKEVGKNLESSLRTLVSESGKSQSAAFQQAVNQAVFAINQSNQIMLNTLNRMSQETDGNYKAVSKGVGEATKSVGGAEQKLAGQINNLAKSVELLPTQFPEPEKVDLSGITKEIKALQSNVKNIPTAKPAKPTDISGIVKRLDKLEKKIAARVFEFIPERDDLDNLIQKVTVKVK